MSALRTKRHRFTAWLAAPLLVLQALAGGVVTLAHATERSSAPRAIEAHHTATCVVLHDALRCALCRYAGSQVRAQPVQAVVPVDRAAPGMLQSERRIHVSGPVHLSAPARAPPSLLS